MQYQYHYDTPYTYENKLFNIKNFNIPFFEKNGLFVSQEIINHTYDLIDIEKMIINNNSTLYFRNNIIISIIKNSLYEKYIANIFILCSFIYNKVLVNNNLMKCFERY